MDTNNEILDAIEILADKKIGDNITKVLTGICKSVNINNNTCVMDSNGVISTVQFYGSPPEVNELYRIFVPSNNMSRSFIVVPPKFTVNPNLLDNWCFGNPVDQRGGYVVPSGTQIYADSALTDTSPGVTEAWRNVIYVNSTYCIYNGTTGSQTYYVKTSDAVRGYTGARYGIDRWQLTNPRTSMRIVSGGVLLSADGGTAYYIHYLDIDIAGKTLTVSVLVGGEVKSFTAVAQIGMTTRYVQVADGCRLRLEYKSEKSMFGVSFSVANGKSVTVQAVKLELGSTQTLAHLENGKWVLNEIPKYEDMLSNCQRYTFNVINSDDNYEILGGGFAMNTSQFFCFIPTPVTLRGKPTVKYSGSFRAVRNISAADGIVINSISVDHASNNGVSVVCVDATSSFEAGEYYTLWCIPAEETNSLIFSADL